MKSKRQDNNDKRRNDARHGQNTLSLHEVKTGKIQNKLLAGTTLIKHKITGALIINKN